MSAININKNNFQSEALNSDKNVPLQALDKVKTVVEHKDTELFVYYYSGARSRQAMAALGQMGYSKVNNIGDISYYRRKVER